MFVALRVRIMLFRSVICVLMLLIVTCQSMAADEASKQSLLFSRVDFSNGAEKTGDGSSTYGSLVFAPAGTLNDDGWRVKLFGSYTTFSYSRLGDYCLNARTAKLDGQELPGGANLLAFCDALPSMTDDERQTVRESVAPLGYTVSGDRIYYAQPYQSTRYELAFTPGYQMTLGAFIMKGYAGIGYENNQLTPTDPGKTLSGGILGGKVGMESWLTLSERFWLSADASYFTATDRYGASTRLGYKPASWLTFGPEAGAFGDKDSDTARAGGFLRFTMWKTETTLSGGFSGTYDGEDVRPYGAASVYMKF